jgi:hypothetical protein
MAVAGLRAIRLALAGSLLCTLLAGAEPTAAASPVPSLFESVVSAPAATPGTAHQRGRRRDIRVRRDVLAQADGSPALGVGQRIGLNLFEDASFTLVVTDVTRDSRGGRTWSGALDGVDLGHAVLAVHGDAVAGTVIMPGAVYRIGHEPDGRQVVEEVDVAALPREAHPLTPASRPAAAGALVGAELPDVAADTAAQIDVMVLYTPAARAAAGGTAAMLAEVNVAVASTNLAYANNGLVQRLRLVFAGEVSITEQPGFNGIDADLTQLGDDPTVAWLRNVTRADLVSLITRRQNPVFCGIGYLMGPGQNSMAFAPLGFSVVERICASGNLSFAHELGHNMGAHHDTFVAGGDPTLFPYSHGYVDLVGNFRTIMAYVDQCEAAGVTPCNKIVYFSTPDSTFGGRPVGSAATADNSRTLGQTANTVANFRQALVPPPTVSTGVNQSSFTAGQTVVISVTLDNPGMTGDADLYLGLLLPGGAILFFTDVGGGAIAFGDAAHLTSFRPIATGVALSSPFSVNVPSFASYQWTGGEPRGGYVFFLLVVKAGALLDGVLASSELLGAALAPFAVP